jgi:hypothetical protein
MRATAILVRWQGGWRWVGDPSLRIEICQGHAGDSSEVIRKAQQELVTYEDGQTEITVGVDPAAGDPVPGVDWVEGDEVFVDGAWREVEALTLTLDDQTGRWTAVPQFGVVLDMPEQRIDRTLKSIGGLNSGTSHLARPVGSLLPPGVRPDGSYSPPE